MDNYNFVVAERNMGKYFEDVKDALPNALFLSSSYRIEFDSYLDPAYSSSNSNRRANNFTDYTFELTIFGDNYQGIKQEIWKMTGFISYDEAHSYTSDSVNQTFTIYFDWNRYQGESPTDTHPFFNSLFGYEDQYKKEIENFKEATEELFGGKDHYITLMSCMAKKLYNFCGDSWMFDHIDSCHRDSKLLLNLQKTGNVTCNVPNRVEFSHILKTYIDNFINIHKCFRNIISTIMDKNKKLEV